MKHFIKALLVVASFIIVAQASAQYANCWQQMVCGPAGCQWVTVCR